MVKILIAGVGDLGRRIALRLARQRFANRLILMGRSSARVEAVCASLSESGASAGAVHGMVVNLLDASQVESSLVATRPDLIVHAASLMSPWELLERGDARAAIVREAGFALQLCGQLPTLHSLMRARRAAGLSTPVVNCSYPDVTHPILAKLGLEPIVGVGNVGMIADHVEAYRSPRVGATGPRVTTHAQRGFRMFAHHAHVISCLCGPGRVDGPGPRVYAAPDSQRCDEVAYSGPRLRLSRDLNELTALHATGVILALSGAAPPRLTHAPGPLGLPGGYPVEVREGHIKLDLPAAIGLEQVLAAQYAYQRLDGIQCIHDDGSVEFTPSLIGRISELHAGLGEPMHPNGALERFALLRRVLDEAARLPRF